MFPTVSKLYLRHFFDSVANVIIVITTVVVSMLALSLLQNRSSIKHLYALVLPVVADIHHEAERRNHFLLVQKSFNMQRNFDKI